MARTRETSHDRPLRRRTADEALTSEILVVDDDDRNLRAIEVALANLDVRVTTVRSGEEALRCLLERDFAVILLDVRMPGLDGFETARLVRQRDRTKHVPIIFVTAYGADDTDIRRGYGVGAVDYLFKPIVPEVLRAKVQVFAELRSRTAQVAAQAERIREIERVEALRHLEEERRKWEAETLGRQIEEQKRVNARLEEIDRRKDEFLALLAHELRNPLASIVAGVELVRLQEPSDPVVRQARDTMERQIQHLTRLVDDLLDVARITQGRLELRKEDVELGEVVLHAVETCRPVIDRLGHEVVLDGPDGPVALRADPVRLTQIVSNLLSNAAHYSDTGGRISVCWAAEDNVARVAVSDTGRGLTPEFIGRAFDMFARERDDGRGLGLGLTLVRQLVEMHGGSVEAFSEGPGKGSEFIVRLPQRLSSGDLDETPVRPERERNRRSRRRAMRVVVVEDDADIREALCALVRLWGHEVVMATGDGAIGVAAIVEHGPDVCLVDIGLPNLDGYGVARRVRSALGSGRPKLVAMTGFGQAHDRRDALEAGFDVHLVKPSTPEELRCAVEDDAHEAFEERPTGGRAPRYRDPCPSSQGE